MMMEIPGECLNVVFSSKQNSTYPVMFFIGGDSVELLSEVEGGQYGIGRGKADVRLTGQTLSGETQRRDGIFT